MRIIFVVSRLTETKDKDAEAKAKEEKKKKSGSGTADTPEEKYRHCCPSIHWKFEVGYGLIPLVDEEQSGNLLARIRSIRRQFALDMGVVIPSLHLRDNLQLKPASMPCLSRATRWLRQRFWLTIFLPWIPAT